MKIFLLTFLTSLSLLISGVSATSQTPKSDFNKEIDSFQNHLNAEFANPKESPLTEEDLKNFKGLDFFPADSKFRVLAKFVRTAGGKPFEMKTTTDRKPIYEKYGEVYFEIDGKKFKLNIYQSHKLRETEEYKTYLFLPFTDLTNGDETYGGGRYIDLQIPQGDTIIIDFNKAYNPYCAYNHKYSCPVPPAENHLDIKIMAGVKAFGQ